MKFKPAIARRFLLLIAGVLWTGVGLMLLGWAVTWWTGLDAVTTVGLAAPGAVLALLAWRFMFSPLVGRNAERIRQAPLRACLFGFQAWKSYFIMGSMIVLGVTLRNSAIPKPWLAVAYCAIGGGLLLASLGYYREFGRMVSTEAAA